ncbi:uncharacterized protein APUU_20149A [Aspergillus puulaauensis]|uniref:Uncharacterized protein n=1 Tax=Aspergillus puulaauensis TaxID=1220207 RepID=A0A7R7XE25_9EURO|nr:uncharacterized protein APUU_20149A [Aspergillus puulaauensis]BCS19717.1 hypothetical protein APUU_20149A [Aspergillus puulaauensis]
MVKFTVLAVAAIGTLTPLVAARNCKTGLNYCGWNLLDIGKYGAQVNQALANANQPADNSHINQSLFHCNGGQDGDISYITYCRSGCHDGGEDESDYC